jgi:hypothetical protein
MTYHYRTAERLAELEENPMAVLTVKRGEGLPAPLPKWDNKNYKGLVHRP